MIEGSLSPEESQEEYFNAALATLERISNLILEIHAYRNQDHIPAYRENLYLLILESQGFLDKPDRDKMFRDWEKVKAFEIKIDKRKNIANYSINLKEELDTLYQWLRLKLHQKKVTIASRVNQVQGIEKIRKRYKI